MPIKTVKANEAKLAITVAIPQSTISSLLVDAVQGTAYWGGVQSKVVTFEAMMHGAHMQFIAEDTGDAALRATLKDEWSDNGEKEKGNHYLLLTGQKIRDGLRLMAENSPVMFARLMAGDLDMGVADKMVQYALFGKLAFG